MATLTGLRDKPHPAHFVGSGKLDELKRLVEAEAVDVVVVNHPITPIQERNMERAAEVRVIDRTRLILDIFAQRASSSEGQLQVELAQLRHLSTRLVRGWTHLERQKGGIGLRGPGETQLETDRRLIGHRIRALSKRLKKVESQRGLRRRARERVPVPVVSLVGYTNAGKSTLFNRLTGESVYVADQLFATLDPTMRRFEVPAFGDIVLSDTVGFIQELPHSLVAAFHSTLEEVINASLLIHVVDAADPDYLDRIEQVNEVLHEIGADQVPTVMVMNKIDLSDDAPGITQHNADEVVRYTVRLSAETGAGLDYFSEAVYGVLAAEHNLVRLLIPPQKAQLRARLYEKCQVLEESITDDGAWQLTANLSHAECGWLQSQSAYNESMLLPAR